MTTNQQINLNELMTMMIVMMVISMMMKMMTKAIQESSKPKPLYPSGPPPGYFIRAPALKAEVVEDKLEAKRLDLEAQGKQIAKEAGKKVRFIGLEPGWQQSYATPIYRFKDKITGREFIARDVEDARWKLEVIRK